jgi:hypothetical protein
VLVVRLMFCVDIRLLRRSRSDFPQGLGVRRMRNMQRECNGRKVGKKLKVSNTNFPGIYLISRPKSWDVLVP